MKGQVCGIEGTQLFTFELCHQEQKYDSAEVPRMSSVVRSIVQKSEVGNTMRMVRNCDIYVS